MGKAVYSQGGVTIEDESGDKVNYRGQSLSFQVIAIDTNAQTAKPCQPSDVDNNDVPKEQDQDDSPPDDISASTSSVVTVR